MMCFLVLNLYLVSLGPSITRAKGSLLLSQDSSVSISSLMEKQNEQVQRALVLVLIPVVVAFSFIVFVFNTRNGQAGSKPILKY